MNKLIGCCEPEQTDEEAAETAADMTLLGIL